MRALHLINVICNCWETAERDLRSFVESEAWGVGEEFITQYFLVKLRTAVTKASELGEIEQAFRQDVEREVMMISGAHFDVASFVSGLQATVTMHPRHIEKLSGGDLGLVLALPTRTPALGHDIQFRSKRRGLLCQAKLGKLSGKNAKVKWGGFSPKQRCVLPERLKYLALLLYEYSDYQLRCLADFSWQLCEGHTFEEVKKWFGKSIFPALKPSREIIMLLADGSIGTSDEHVIQNYIEPKVDYYFAIHIGWPDEPPDGMKLLENLRQREKEKLTEKLSNW